MKLFEKIRKDAAILIVFAVLSIIVFMIYHRGANGPYMLDDFLTLRINKTLKMESLNIQSLGSAAFSMNTGPLYRPVSMLSFALNYYFAGNIDGYPIKLLNVIIHIITGWGVFLLSLLLLRRHEMADNPGDNSGDWSQWTGIVALFIAALWFLHPLHVSTVLYTVQRMTELAAMFSLYAAIAYVKGRDDLIKGRLSGLWWVIGAVVVGGSFAGLSKENGFLLPFLLLSIEVIFFRFKFHPDIQRKSRYWVYGILILPCIGILAYLAGLVLTMPEGATYRNFTLWERLLTEGRVIFYYIRLILVPDITIMGLNYDYYPVSRGFLSPPSTIISIIGAGIIFLFAVYGALKNRFTVLSFAILWFLAGHLLESTVVQLELVYEHRNYLPAYGIIFAAGYYISRAILQSKRLQGSLRYAAMILLLILLAIPLYQRVGNWSLPSRFFMNEIKNHPESARNIGGLAYQQLMVRQYPRAAESYKMAYGLAPHEAGYLLASLDIIIHKLNELPTQDMVDTIDETLRNYKVSHFSAYQLFTIADNSLSRPEDSSLSNRSIIERLLATAVANKHPWPADYYLGTTLFQLAEIRFRQNRWEDAVAPLEKAVQLVPEKYDARVGLTRIYMHLNRVDKAEEQIKWLEGRQMDPEWRTILSKLRQELILKQQG